MELASFSEPVFLLLLPQRVCSVTGKTFRGKWMVKRGKWTALNRGETPVPVGDSSFLRGKELHGGGWSDLAGSFVSSSGLRRGDMHRAR
jgi:hypothetical protein